MVTVISSLPVLPPHWAAERDFRLISSLPAAAVPRQVEPVGPHFLAHSRRLRHKRTFSEDDRLQAADRARLADDSETEEELELEDPMMLQREAKDWKSQDHYAVLGLSRLRYRATEAQIKRAHRRKVLKHHPDKKAAAGIADDDNFFKCIQKATEVLLDPVRRRQFDSVDDGADVDPPTKKALAGAAGAGAAAAEQYLALWGRVFAAEARFSKAALVPMLGGVGSTREEVDEFYNFWYSFDSWRSFEYLDEDVPDDNENRDQKRHMERKNASARKKKKAEDNARLRRLVDECAAGDERIKRFRQAASAARNQKRLAREADEKRVADEAQARKAAEARAALEAESSAKADREAGKKAREAAKNAAKKNKRVLKASLKEANYFAGAGAVADAAVDAMVVDADLVQAKMEPEEIAALAARLGGLKVADEIRAAWAGEVGRLVEAGRLKKGDASTLE